MKLKNYTERLRLKRSEGKGVLKKDQPSRVTIRICDQVVDVQGFLNFSREPTRSTK